MVRQLVATYVLLVALAIGGFTIPVAVTLTGQLRSDTESAVRREAETGARLLAVDDDPSRQALASLVDAFERQTPGRMDVLLAGRRPAAPQPTPVASDDAAFSAALAGREWQRWGYAPALDAEGLVLAVPAHGGDGEVVGAVRISYPAAPVDTRIQQIWMFRAALAGAVLIVAALLGSLLARRLTRPLRELNEMASVLRDGDLTARAKESGPAEVRTLARTLNTATETIDALIRSQRAFVADASHQLRTPLTALRLALDNIADGTDDPTTREDVERATAEVVRMTRLVNGLLALAKAQAQVAPVARVPVNRVVAERFEIWRAVADDRAVELRLDAPASDIFALATPGHLEQVLDNVLSNALDFSPNDGVVTVSVRRQEGRVVTTVMDDGPGLSPAERERAFDRFWRGPAGPGRSGFGLGLAIVKQLVVDNGGTVDLGESPSGGVAVRIALRAA
ncbi:HAMP domain-containing histidine kinase [Micromonospora sp. KC723]|nr:HAMP domain-containing histidine kinase [Micromonospora sp. KC723]